MSRHYLKNIRMYLICLLSFSSLTAVSSELGFAMDQEKIEGNGNVIPKTIKIEDQNLDFDWDVVAKNHEETAFRLKKILNDMQLKDIPSPKEGELTYAQLILKHQELSVICKEIGELNKNNVDISIKKNEFAQKLAELYGPLTIEYNPRGILQKIVALRKISEDLTLVLGNGYGLSDKAIIINNDPEKNPDILANFFASSFVATVQKIFRGIKLEKIILGDLPPKFLLDEILLNTLKKLSSEGTKIIFNDNCHFISLDQTCFTEQELSERGRKGPFHTVTISMIVEDIEGQKESIYIEQETPLSSRLIVRDKSKKELGRSELTKEDRIHTLVHRHHDMLQLFSPHGFKVYVFKFPANEFMQPDFTNDNLVPQALYPKQDASPYVWKAVFNPENKPLETETRDLLRSLELNALRPVSFEEFASILSTPEKKKIKPPKKKINNKIKTIETEKNDLNDKSVDQILKEFERIDKNKKNNDNKNKINNNNKISNNSKENNKTNNNNENKKENHENNINKKN